MLTLQFPIKQSISFSSSIFRLYYSALKSSENIIQFNLTKSISITPFSLMMIASLVRECANQKKSCIYVPPQNANLQRKLREMGFNKFFWQDVNGSDSIEIQNNAVQLCSPKGIDYFLADRIINVFDHHLNLSPGVKDSLNMSIRETMTNVVDHSGTNEYYVCAKAYKRDRKIKLCILDTGKGIYNLLKPYYNYIKDDYNAIELAIQEGITSRDNPAGYGLHHIKRFIEVNKGKMWIISGLGKVTWKGQPFRSERQNMPIPFNGTIVKLEINIDRETFYFLRSEKEKFF